MFRVFESKVFRRRIGPKMREVRERGTKNCINEELHDFVQLG
jgi:hypothetical protein